MRKSATTEKSDRRRRIKLYHPAVVWALRIAVGAVFVLSGFVKGVDPWGSVIKIGEYFTAWGLDVPDGLTVFAAFMLAAMEFVWGLLLMLGLYRKLAPQLLTAMMAVMLPLTLYIAVANPVSDCGCFGDFWVLSNRDTFLKNVVITLALIYLWAFNRRTSGLLHPAVQWMAGGWATLFILAIELFGYNIQPLLDFRRFAPGTELLAVGHEDEDGADVEYSFVYEKDGEEREFSADALPDSTWTFVDRRLVSGSEELADGFSIIRDGEDIAPDLIAESGEQFIVTIPDARRVNLSGTYLLNDLNDFIRARGGSMLALVGSGEADIEWWRDISMADYPVERAEAKLLKELARGSVALVYLRDGRVVWKRTLTSIPFTLAADTPKERMVEEMNPDCIYILKVGTIIFVGALAVLIFLDRSGKLVAFALRRRKLKAALAKRRKVAG